MSNSFYDLFERGGSSIAKQSNRCRFIFFHPETRGKLCEYNSQNPGAVYVFVHDVCVKHMLTQVLVTCFDKEKNNTHAVYEYQLMK
jgi:hypothetical protein